MLFVMQSLPSTALHSLAVSLLLSRLDYGNSTLAGIPVYDCYAPHAIYFECRSQVITVGNRAFPVAAAKVSNQLPGDVTASQSLGRQLQSVYSETLTRLFPNSILLSISAIAV